MSRLDDLGRFYLLLDRLEVAVGGKRRLQDFRQHKDWPSRGLYIFFEPGEDRSDSGVGPRVTRIGTHALKLGSKSSLRQRLNQHRGAASGGGNHRGSIFRLLVGDALIARGDAPPCPSWGVKGDLTKAAEYLNSGRRELLAAERPIEEAVSRYIGAMPFLWVEVADDPSQESARGYLERNSIALVSNHDRPSLDSRSVGWLGRYSSRALVTGSGLWNQRHVNEKHDPLFLEALEMHIEGALRS